MKPKVSRMKEIIKIRAEINELEIKKTVERINETKSWFFEKTETKLTETQPDLLRKKERRLKDIKLEMKDEKLQQIPQKTKEQ